MRRAFRNPTLHSPATASRGSQTLFAPAQARRRYDAILLVPSCFPFVCSRGPWVPIVCPRGKFRGVVYVARAMLMLQSSSFAVATYIGAVAGGIGLLVALVIFGIFWSKRKAKRVAKPVDNYLTLRRAQVRCLTSVHFRRTGGSSIAGWSFSGR
jgi:hypothetical protein